MAAELPLYYYRIEQPYRNNVREAIPPPRMLLVKQGRREHVEVILNEPQLLAMLKDITSTLEAMRKGRNATQPQGK